MPGNTPNLNLPYPEPTDPPAGSEQLQDLADAVDAALASVAGRFASAGGSFPLGAGGNEWGNAPVTADVAIGDLTVDDKGRVVIGSDGLYEITAAAMRNGREELNLAVFIDWPGTGPVSGDTAALTRSFNDYQALAFGLSPLKKGQTLTLGGQGAAAPVTFYSAHLYISRSGIAPSPGRAIGYGLPPGE